MQKIHPRKKNCAQKKSRKKLMHKIHLRKNTAQKKFAKKIVHEKNLRKFFKIVHKKNPQKIILHKIHPR